MTLHPTPIHPHHYTIPTLNFTSGFLASPPPFLTLPPSSSSSLLPHKSPPCWARMDSGPAAPGPLGIRHNKKEKLVVIMGATGAGKSRLSIDLAAHFLPSSSASFEIINSDKIQVYKGLDITTNKIPVPDRLGVPHHLLGELDGGDELTASEFRNLAGKAVSAITSRNKVPMLVGGSNSLIHALLVDRFEPNVDLFQNGAVSVSSKLRYDCCFLWVDVSWTVLAEYLNKRVDEMLDSGMFEELAEFRDPDEDDDDLAVRTGLRKAIGVPEFSRFFKKYPPGVVGPCHEDDPPGVVGPCHEDDLLRRGAYGEAVRAIKENTCQLAKKQIGKILTLKGKGWDLRRLDATEAFRAVVTSDERWSEIWEEQIVEPSVKIVKRFLEQE